MEPFFVTIKVFLPQPWEPLGEPTTLGERIRYLRLKKSLKVKELAKKLHVHSMTVGHWENRNLSPTRSHLDRLKRAFPEIDELSMEIIYPGYPKNPVTFGDKLKKKRLDLGLSRKEMAKKLDVCIDTIYDLECSRHKTERGHVFKRIKKLMDGKTPKTIP